MSYVTITSWEIRNGAIYDVSMSNIRKKRLPALKELGATSAMLVRTGDRTSAVITEWPDVATRDTAEAAIEAVRSKVRQYDMARMTGEMKGVVIATV